MVLRWHLSAGLLIGMIFTGSAPQGLEAQVRQSLAETAEEWMHTFRAQDAHAIASYMAEDVIAHYPGWDVPTLGRTANEEAWASYFTRRPHHPLSTEVVVTAESEDLGYTMGQALYAEATDPEADGGRYVAVWRRMNGEWKIVVFAAHRHSDVSSETFLRTDSGGRDFR